jgi:hypothetical protein
LTIKPGAPLRIATLSPTRSSSVWRVDAEGDHAVEDGISK